MILIFDLDDTLYDESSFVTSGLGAVARHGQAAYGWNAERSLDFMLDVLEREGRGRVFDRWLASHEQLSKARVAECVNIYRHHRPSLELFPAARLVLDRYRGQVPLYLVTDGHKIVQKNKVDALGLSPEFQRVFITHRFGIRHAKPSIHCFELIRQAEGCRWADMVYVGDNPSKDFVNLKPLGALTVRVQTGGHRDVVALPGYDSQVSIPDLDALPEVLAAHFERSHCSLSA
ncbi:putative hydrolase of the HAD superfamily [Pseudomonas migulae]|uniref:HAD family hydrolase n=1 Tax=Pseudomonas migulae TaxID=78543 RepID=UPI0020A13E73|nr:HAD family hydrolase [Pseudomonas migulae]MCP1500410.1 putative hydrolase of the HAD superfamily [Pseudomonas migulae]